MSEPSRPISTDQRLDPELKASWLKALRSGEFPQGQNYLYRKGEFCCMGVLAVVAGYPTDTLNSKEDLSDIECNILGEWDKSIRSPCFLASEPSTHTTIQRKLAGMNDMGKSFAEIAWPGS